MLELYQNIRKRRIDLGLSQDELAKKIGYTSRSSIAKIEAGEFDIPQRKIMKFAEALETTPGQLMGWDEVSEEASLDATIISRLSHEEKLMVKKYSQLSEADKLTVQTIVDRLIAK